MDIITSNRQVNFASLKSVSSSAGEDDFMEVTEWSNLDGYDVVISRKTSEERFSVTHEELSLLNVLVNWKGE